MKKVKIYTFADKAPYFIPWQYKSLKNFLKDDFEYIVMNNSSDENIDRDIKNHCGSLAVKCLDVENKDFKTAVYACSAPIQECIDKYISQDRDCINVIMDSDLFLMSEFSFDDYMEGYDIAAIMQARQADKDMVIEYWWNCLLVINDTAPDIDKIKMWPGTINHAPCDVGAMSYFYLLYHPELRLRKIPGTGLITDHPEVIKLIPEHVRGEYDFDYHMEILHGSFLHFRGGSRWDNRPVSFYQKKEEFIRKLVKA